MQHLDPYAYRHRLILRKVTSAPYPIHTQDHALARFHGIVSGGFHRRIAVSQDKLVVTVHPQLVSGALNAITVYDPLTTENIATSTDLISGVFLKTLKTLNPDIEKLVSVHIGLVHGKSLFRHSLVRVPQTDQSYLIADHGLVGGKYAVTYQLYELAQLELNSRSIVSGRFKIPYLSQKVDNEKLGSAFDINQGSYGLRVVKTTTQEALKPSLLNLSGTYKKGILNVSLREAIAVNALSLSGVYTKRVKELLCDESSSTNFDITTGQYNKLVLSINFTESALVSSSLIAGELISRVKPYFQEDHSLMASVTSLSGLLYTSVDSVQSDSQILSSWNQLNAGTLSQQQTIVSMSFIDSDSVVIGDNVQLYFTDPI